MSYTFDFFVAPLVCEHCGSVSTEDESTNMQTKLAAEASLRPYRRGDEIDIYAGGIEACGYLCVRPPVERRSFVLLDSWECPSCSSPFNWARISIRESVICDISAVILSADVIAAANYVSEDCEYVGWTVDEAGPRYRHPELG